MVHSHYKKILLYKSRLVGQGLLVGLFAGTIVSAYRYTLACAAELTPKIYIFLKAKEQMIPLWFILLLFIGLIIGKMIIHLPIIKASGIPQVKGVIQGHMQMGWFSTIWGKFVSSVMAITCGASLGREGPSVQLGAAAGQGISRLCHNYPVEDKYLISAGAGAGLAAAFNAPLGGVMFALEEVNGSFSHKIVLPSFCAAIAADVVANYIFGLKPIFSFLNLDLLPLKDYWLLFPLGIILGLTGMLFNQSMYFAQDLYQKHFKIPLLYRPIICLFLTAIVGFFLPEILGGGENLITSLPGKDLIWQTVALLFISKLVLTSLCAGSATPGGTLLPLLSLGALVGNFYYVIMVVYGDIPTSYLGNFISLAMAGYFASVVKAPVTGIIMIAEMCGSLEHVLPLSIVSITSYLTTELFASKPLFDSLLDRMLEK